MFYITTGSLNSLNHSIIENSLKVLNSSIREKIQLISNTKKYTGLDCRIDIDESWNCLDLVDNACGRMKRGDILITMPANKADLRKDNSNFKGYTDYLNSKFKQKNFMTFFTPVDVIVLLTDHISIDEVTKSSLAISKDSKYPNILLEQILKLRPDIKHVEFYGINPHCGEEGIISRYDIEYFENFRNNLKQIRGITAELYCSADSTFIGSIADKPKIKIYCYHDQALPLLKHNYSFFSFNATIGLPFLRTTLSHGTGIKNLNNTQVSIASFLYMMRFLSSLKGKQIGA